MSKKDETYDWLNDPFDEKKAAAEREQARMGSGAKLGVGCVAVIAVLFVIGCIGVFSLAIVGLGGGL